MHWRLYKDLQYIQFPAVAGLPQFFHAIFLRDRTCRAADSRPLNVGLDCGDSDAHVWQNRKRILSLWNRPTGIFARQVHGIEVGAWTGANGLPDSNNAVVFDGDVLVSDQPESALVIQTADCQPVIVVDPVRRVVANVHSGWRGSIQNVIGRAIEAMVVRFGCRPEHLVAGIGPSLGPCCAEFVHYRQEFPQSLWPYRGSSDRFDFWRLSVDQLSQAGVKRSNISLAGICTQCNPHLFFSYRAEKQTGRFASVVGIRGQGNDCYGESV